MNEQLDQFYQLHKQKHLFLLKYLIYNITSLSNISLSKNKISIPKNIINAIHHYACKYFLKRNLQIEKAQ